MYFNGSLSSHSLGFHLVSVHMYVCVEGRGSLAAAISFDLHSFIVALNIIDRHFVSHFLNMHIHQLASYKSKEKFQMGFLVHCISLILCWTFVDPQRDRTHYVRLVISNFYSPTLIMVSFPTCLFIPQLPRVLTIFIFIEQSHMIVTCLRYC